MTLDNPIKQIPSQAGNDVPILLLSKTSLILFIRHLGRDPRSLNLDIQLHFEIQLKRFPGKLGMTILN